MNLQAVVGIVRAVGLCVAISLVGCDSGEKKAEEKKPEAKVEAKAEEKKAAPEEKKADVADVKTADPAGDAKAPAGDPPAGDAKAPAGDAKAPAGDAKAPAGDTKGDTKTSGIDGKPLYDAKCKVCHAADGKGTDAMKKNKIPDMSAGDWQSKHDKATIVKAITDGVDGTKMKAFKDKLKPEEIEAVAVYVKGMK